MTSSLIDEAAKIISEPQVLINIISKRVRQLNSGHRPMIDVGPFTSTGDIALMEVIQGKLSVQKAETEEAAV